MFAAIPNRVSQSVCRTVKPPKAHPTPSSFSSSSGSVASISTPSNIIGDPTKPASSRSSVRSSTLSRADDAIKPFPPKERDSLLMKRTISSPPALFAAPIPVSAPVPTPAPTIAVVEPTPSRAPVRPQRRPSNISKLDSHHRFASKYRLHTANANNVPTKQQQRHASTASASPATPPSSKKKSTGLLCSVCGLTGHSHRSCPTKQRPAESLRTPKGKAFASSSAAKVEAKIRSVQTTAPVKDALAKGSSAPSPPAAAATAAVASSDADSQYLAATSLFVTRLIHMEPETQLFASVMATPGAETTPESQAVPSPAPAADPALDSLSSSTESVPPPVPEKDTPPAKQVVFPTLSFLKADIALQHSLGAVQKVYGEPLESPVATSSPATAALAHGSTIAETTAPRPEASAKDHLDSSATDLRLTDATPSSIIPTEVASGAHSLINAPRVASDIMVPPKVETALATPTRSAANLPAVQRTFPVSLELGSSIQHRVSLVPLVPMASHLAIVEPVPTAVALQPTAEAFLTVEPALPLSHDLVGAEPASAAVTAPVSILIEPKVDMPSQAPSMPSAAALVEEPSRISPRASVGKQRRRLFRDQSHVPLRRLTVADIQQRFVNDTVFHRMIGKALSVVHRPFNRKDRAQPAEKASASAPIDSKLIFKPLRKPKAVRPKPKQLALDFLPPSIFQIKPIRTAPIAQRLPTPPLEFLSLSPLSLLPNKPFRSPQKGIAPRRPNALAHPLLRETGVGLLRTPSATNLASVRPPKSLGLSIFAQVSSEFLMSNHDGPIGPKSFTLPGSLDPVQLGSRKKSNRPSFEARPFLLPVHEQLKYFPHQSRAPSVRVRSFHSQPDFLLPLAPVPPSVVCPYVDHKEGEEEVELTPEPPAFIETTSPQRPKMIMVSLRNLFTFYSISDERSWIAESERIAAWITTKARSYACLLLALMARTAESAFAWMDRQISSDIKEEIKLIQTYIHTCIEIRIRLDLPLLFPNEYITDSSGAIVGLTRPVHLLAIRYLGRIVAHVVLRLARIQPLNRDDQISSAESVPMSRSASNSSYSSSAAAILPPTLDPPATRSLDLTATPAAGWTHDSTDRPRFAIEPDNTPDADSMNPPLLSLKTDRLLLQYECSISPSSSPNLSDELSNALLREHELYARSESVPHSRPDTPDSVAHSAPHWQHSRRTSSTWDVDSPSLFASSPATFASSPAVHTANPAVFTSSPATNTSSPTTLTSTPTAANRVPSQPVHVDIMPLPTQIFVKEGNAEWEAFRVKGAGIPEEVLWIEYQYLKTTGCLSAAYDQSLREVDAW
ncbi:uncharacterized protein BJ171DRAFT_99318 [Polychytrium aggregatum]|uniref:uncharacterized protein n=1 Tax=Polychytrium aggregatum TaxID=110093 RepID=UPI0022FE1812|nr:uncharacterized protein BJ171DRAFT_99318 [Polychytrium aggregatum]KAI9204658.1 hypothetical protein BJ171DRAFT_99318 [Polychytrium aggregatum]